MSGLSVVESTIRGFTRALSKALASERTAGLTGIMQNLDPRVRVVGILMLVVAVVASHRLRIIATLFLLAVLLALACRISLMSLVKRVWLVVLVFTGLIAIPALFLTPGERMLAQSGLAVTRQGIHSALLLILRVETTATLMAVLVLTTPWFHILKALRALRLPAEVVTMLAMTHRYVFLLIETANQMFESRQSRTVGRFNPTEHRHMTSRTAGVLLSKTIELSHEVYLAMLSRGFRGEIRLLANFRMRSRDYAALVLFLLVGFAAVWAGRS